MLYRCTIPDQTYVCVFVCIVSLPVPTIGYFLHPTNPIEPVYIRHTTGINEQRRWFANRGPAYTDSSLTVAKILHLPFSIILITQKESFESLLWIYGNLKIIRDVFSDVDMFHQTLQFFISFTIQ